MKVLTSSVQKIGFTTGVLTACGLIIFFLLMKSAGLERVLEFRYFNLFILLGAIWYAIYKLKNEFEGEDFYLKGMAVGVYTACIGVFIFAFFISFYMAFIDPDLLKYIQNTISHGAFLNAPAIFLILFMEGMASAVIITFSLMQYFKSQVHAHLPE